MAIFFFLDSSVLKTIAIEKKNTLKSRQFFKIQSRQMDRESEGRN